jgi:hypothetical protein
VADHVKRVSFEDEFEATIANDFGDLGPGTASAPTGEPRSNRGPRQRGGPRR